MSSNHPFYQISFDKLYLVCLQYNSIPFLSLIFPFIPLPFFGPNNVRNLSLTFSLSATSFSDVQVWALTLCFFLFGFHDNNQVADDKRQVITHLFTVDTEIFNLFDTKEFNEAASNVEKCLRQLFRANINLRKFSTQVSRITQVRLLSSGFMAVFWEYS